jgi:hypothetical protein
MDKQNMKQENEKLAKHARILCRITPLLLFIIAASWLYRFLKSADASGYWGPVIHSMGATVGLLLIWQAITGYIRGRCAEKQREDFNQLEHRISKLEDRNDEEKS